MISRRHLDKVLTSMLRSNKGVSDLFFVCGRPCQVEVDGKLSPVELDPELGVLTPYQTEMIALTLMGGNRELMKTLVKTGSCDCAYEIPGECRFRVNIFQQRKKYSMVLRKLETNILSLDDLKLPTVFKTMAAEKNGLILVTGATGSGKSTTLAALLNEMNETRAVHILTIEDPIEFVHPHKKATFNQRELGIDFDTFPSSLKAALREAPKVILIGEMRDKQTVELGLCAASTGHLVLSTLHSIDAGQTINRIVSMYDKDEEEQIRAKLAECLRFVVSQRLLPKVGGGRAACQEIMGVNLRIRDLIVNGETEEKTFYDATSQGGPRGWQTHDQVIEGLYSDGLITEESALAYASKKPIVLRAIDRIKQERGIVEDNGMPELKMQSEVEA